MRPGGAFDGPGRATGRRTPHQSLRDFRVPQVITQSQRHIVSVDVSNGRLLWQIPFTTDFDQNIVTPVVVDDLLIYSGNQRPLAAVRVVQRSGKWSTSAVWQNEALPNYMSTPVVVGDTLYGLTQRNRGQFFAADVRVGQDAVDHARTGGRQRRPRDLGRPAHRNHD